MRVILLLLALAVGASGTGFAQSTNSAPAAKSDVIQFTAHDVAALLKAVQDADTSPKISIKVLGKTSSEMPAYDPLVHFADSDATSGAATVWMLSSITKTEAAARAFRAALELACMSTGFAGPLWKSIYDQVAAADAALPPNSPNPFQNRLALTQRIQSIVDSYTPR